MRALVQIDPCGRTHLGNVRTYFKVFYLLASEPPTRLPITFSKLMCGLFLASMRLNLFEYAFSSILDNQSVLTTFPMEIRRYCISDMHLIRHLLRVPGRNTIPAREEVHNGLARVNVYCWDSSQARFWLWTFY